MSGYGPPSHVPPNTAPNTAPTTPMQAPAAQQPPARSRMPAAQEPSSLIGYAAGALGVLSFIWGFLTWYSQHNGFAGSEGVSGYSIAGGGAGAAIGLSIAAGLIAAGGVLERKRPALLPAALALAALLVTIGAMIGKGVPGSRIGSGVGLILELITTILQAAGLTYLWLRESDRVPTGRSRSAQPAWPGGSSQYGQFAPPPGQFPPAAPPGGYAPPRRDVPEGYQPPSAQHSSPGYEQQGYRPPQGYQAGQGYQPQPAYPPSTPASSSSGTPSAESWHAQDPATEQWSPPVTGGSGSTSAEAQRPPEHDEPTDR